jgi:hypothetical protein
VEKVNVSLLQKKKTSSPDIGELIKSTQMVLTMESSTSSVSPTRTDGSMSEAKTSREESSQSEEQDVVLVTEEAQLEPMN